MYTDIDRNILSSLINLYEQVKHERKSYSRRAHKINMILDEKLVLLSSFFTNYATLYYEGLTNASHMPLPEIKDFIEFERKDLLEEIFENNDILTALIGLYYDIDKVVNEFGEDVCNEHLKGLIARRDSVKQYIDIFACRTLKKYSKVKNMPVEELFKSMHGIYPAPYQKQLRDKRKRD